MVRSCSGLSDGTPCTVTNGGQPMQPKFGNAPCLFCDPELLDQRCSNPKGRVRLKQLLHKMDGTSRIIALRRLPEQSYTNHFEAEFGARDRAAPVEACRGCGQGWFRDR